MNSTPLYFPVASCAGIPGPDAAQYDRQWLVVDDEWAWLGRESQPRLADVRIELRFGYLVIRAPGMLRVDLPLDVIEDDDSVRRMATVAGKPVDVVDEGDLAAAWMSNFLGVACRLVKVHPDAGPVAWPTEAG